MSALSLRLPTSLHGFLRDAARREGVSINQFIATAVAEKMSALHTEDYLAQRARGGSREKYIAVLARVPAKEPLPDDRVVSSAPARRTARATKAAKRGKR